MELPKEIKSLYRHLEFHTLRKQCFDFKYKIPSDVLYFVSERMGIWEKKVSGENPPFTKDPILAKYRFCNIYRELDRQTIEFHKMLNPIRNDFALWLLNMFYFRMTANIDTVKTLGLISFDKKENKDFYNRFIKLKRPKFGTPYVFPISVIYRSEFGTREFFISHYLPSIIMSVAEEIKTWKKMSVYDGVLKILKIFGFNLHFLWTEVLIDVAYQFPEYIDLFKRFPIGPGAVPTLKKINNSNEDGSIFVERLANLGIQTILEYEGSPVVLSSENWEGVACEFRKYTNLKNKVGRKRLYKGFESVNVK